MKNVTIFGATGKTGLLLIDKAVQKGFNVTAFTRSPEKLKKYTDTLSIISGDVCDLESVAGAIGDSEAVISTVGRGYGSPADLVKTAANNIVAGMKERNATRIVWASSASIQDPNDEPTLINRLILRTKIVLNQRDYLDALNACLTIKRSGLEWVIARSPRLTDNHKQKKYRIGYVDGKMRYTLSRATYAKFLLDQLSTDEWLYTMPVVSDY